MKPINILLSCTLFLALLATGCKKDNSALSGSQESPFGVVSSTVTFDYEGGTGHVELSDEGFACTLSTGAEQWITVTKTGKRGLKVVATPNPGADTRNALIVVDKEGKKAHIPVTQLGRVDYDYADLKDLSFSEKGGEQHFRIHAESPLEVTQSEGSAEWLTIEQIEDRLYFRAKPNTTSKEREATVTIKAGLYKKVLTVNQKVVLNFAPVNRLDYRSILGEYIFHTTIDGKKLKVPVTLEAHQEGKSVFLKGLAIDLLLQIDENKLVLASNQHLPEDVYYIATSGLGEQECSIFDLIGSGIAKFIAPAEATPNGQFHRFVFKSPNKGDCEVKKTGGDGKLVGTGVFKEPKGIVLYDAKTNTPYGGPNGDKLGEFFDFYLVQE